MSETPLQVLLVEDSALTAEQLCELMRTGGNSIDITTVATERQALAELATSKTDLVILDLKLRQGTGFSVLKKVNASDPKPCIVVMTNYALPRYKELALSNGADYFLDKAVDFKELPGIIETVAKERAATVEAGAAL